MIVLKHICAQHEVDPYDLRRALRNAKLKPTNSRWKWDNDHPDLTKVHEVAKALKEKSNVSP